MPFYKDAQGNLHELDDKSFEYLLPSGSVEITDVEVAELQKPTVTVGQAKAVQLEAINIACEKSIAAIKANYPASEVLSWPKQEDEARSYVADPGAVTPLLDALAEARGIDKAELARRVILKADSFAQYSGATIGKRQALEDALNALPADATVEQIAAIAW